MTHKCTACEGIGETLDSAGGYYDWEPPTKRCYECDGTGDGEIQNWKRSVWRDTMAHVNATRLREAAQ